MKAMVLHSLADISANPTPLELTDLPEPQPKDGELLIRVVACGVCHTELDEIEGRTPPVRLPMVLGHQVVGYVEATGNGVDPGRLGERVGVAWIFSACGQCKFCLRDSENLCPHFRATGRDANGGYAQLMTVPEAFAFSIPATFSDSQAAPLLCAGAIGYRSLRLCNVKDGFQVGLTGFGASGHLVLKMIQHRYPSSDVFVFARSPKERAFALELGAAWAGDTADTSPTKLDAIIDTTPVWKPVVEALRNLEAGGRLVINAIRKESADQGYLLRLDYVQHLWQEKETKTVANVTRRDVREFLELASEKSIKPEVQEYALSDANQALVELKQGEIRGAKVLRID
jgi:propanol-preferring alcohol dehydrogenase